MTFSMAELLAYSRAVPEAAREALKTALRGAPEQRVAELEQAARLLHHTTGLDCSDARELVGLPEGAC